MRLSLSSGTLVTFLLATIRALSWVAVSPPFASRAVPSKVKVVLAVALATVMVPTLPAGGPRIDDLPAVLGAVVLQVVVGASLGFLTMLIFAAVQAAGDLVDLFGGFSLAYAFDPLMQTGNSVFGKLYGLLATTMLVVSGGHLLILRGFLGSYQALPLDTGPDLGGLDHSLTDAVGALLIAALQIAGPMIVVLFLADVGLGLLTRIAPALNAFSIGFPAKILLTLVLAGVVLPVLPAAVDQLTNGAVRELVTFVRGGG
jgi:flagellar biosynthetic protein FliR